MECPKCGYEQQDGYPECQKCGVVFAKVLKSASLPSAIHAVPEENASPLPEDSQTEKPPAPLYAVVLLILFIAGVGWWLHFPSGLSMPQNAYISSPKGFALSPPPEWVMITPQNYEKIMEQYKDLFPQKLRKHLLKPGFEVSFVKIPEGETEFTPSFNVVAVPFKGNLPALTESEKENAAKIISEEMSKHLDTYQLESSAIVKVDKLASLQITGTAALTLIFKPSSPIMSEPGAFGMRHVVGHTEKISKEFKLKTVQNFVPGHGKGYIISCTHDETAYPEVEPAFNAVMESFRVLDRPPRFGPVIMGAFNGGLIGAGGYLLWILLGRLVKKD